MKHILAPIALALTLTTPIFATPASAMDMKLPAACGKPDHDMSMDKSMEMSDMPMKDFQKEFMDGMQQMDSAMSPGMMQNDADVAFICGMIAHHMGAVQMSEIELKYGKDGWARKLAQVIIDAQMKEIDEMTKWLEKRPK